MKPLKRIYIEITNVCNLSCSFCPPLKREKKFMDVADFEKIIKKITPYTDYVYLHVKGEPLMHSKLGTFLKICEENNLYANITTNGTKIFDRKEILTTSSLRQINISLHSFERVEEHTTKEFDLFMSSVLSAVKYIHENSNTIISLRLWNLDKDMASSSGPNRNLEVIDRINQAFSLNFDLNIPFGINNGIKLADRIYLSRDYEFAWPNLDVDVISDKGYCYGLKTQLAILVDGTVVPCCLDENGTINLGNLLEEEFDDILNSNRARQIREGFACRNVVEELCKRCGYRERFN